MAAKKRAKAAPKEWYVSGEDGDFSTYEQALEDVKSYLVRGDGEENPQYIYRLVPVKIVRRAEVIVEDVP